MKTLCTLRKISMFLRKCRIFRMQTRNAVDLAYKIHGNVGSNPPIVVLHGLLGSKRNWETVSKRISERTGTAVVAADLRNHGESPHTASHTYPELSADVSQLLNKLSIPAAKLIGHSMGGRTAMTLALTEPNKVLKLLIVDISPVSTAGILNNFFPQLLKLMESINFSNLDVSEARILAKEKIKASGLIEHDSLMAFIIMNVGKRFDGKIGWQCNTEALQKHFEDIASFPKMGGKMYRGPVLFIGGGRSNYIPPTDLNGIRELFPEADLKYVKEAGHNVHAEDTATFLNLATEFLK